MRLSNWLVWSVVCAASGGLLNSAGAETSVKLEPAAIAPSASTQPAGTAANIVVPTTNSATTTSVTTSVTTTGAAAASQPDPVKTCEAYLSTLPAPPKKPGHHPIRLVAKALASELGTDGSNMLKDSMFVFSAKDFDPYDKKAPRNKPYTLLEMQMIDGSEASVIKYPDNSAKVVGGYADGTIIAPNGKSTYIVAYPNGARGKLVKVSGNEYDIYRPDNSITRITKTAGGDYEMSNSKMGYIGTARTDTQGMQFEMHSKDF